MLLNSFTQDYSDKNRSLIKSHGAGQLSRKIADFEHAAENEKGKKYNSEKKAK